MDRYSIILNKPAPLKAIKVKKSRARKKSPGPRNSMDYLQNRSENRTQGDEERSMHLPAQTTLIDQWFNIICESLEWVRERNQTQDANYWSDGVDGRAYKSEMGSFTIHLPRRMGNSTLASRLLNEYQDSILIIPFRDWMGNYRHRNIEAGRIHIPAPFDLISLRALLVVVDGTSYLLPNQITAIYSIRAEQFVFLG